MPRRKPRRLPKSFPALEVRALIGAADREQDRLILSVGIGMGLRVSEITKLETTDIDWQEGIALVREGKGQKDRSVPVAAGLLAQLRAWVGDRQSGHLFPAPRGGRLTSRAIQLMIKRVAVRAGLAGAEDPRRIHPHRLRHTFATRLLRSGADIIEVRDLLGHGSVATTQVYLSAESGRLKSAVERAAEGLDNAKVESEVSLPTGPDGKTAQSADPVTSQVHPVSSDGPPDTQPVCNTVPQDEGELIRISDMGLSADSETAAA